MNWLTVLLGLCILLLITLGCAAWHLYRQLRQLRVENNERMAKELKLSAATGSERPRLIITLEILNPLELVAERSWIGGKVSSLSPTLMHRVVVNQTRDQLTAGMNENGVAVDARVIRIG